MVSVTIDEMQHDALKYLKQVEAGETLVIFRANIAIAEIKPVVGPKSQRPFGLCAGEFIVPDDFDAPLPQEILDTFDGK